MTGPRVFLTAEWRCLAMLSFTVDPALLLPLVPRGTELDSHDGRTLLSLVGFRFLRTRVLGIPIPLHRDFDEVNLRFYVRRETGGELRRGVTFIREIVPRRLIAAVARLAYNEPYVALRMQSEVPASPGVSPSRVRYAWKNASWQHMTMSIAGTPFVPDPWSEAAFITEHHGGYTRQRDGGTMEYRVEHPPWRVWTAERPELGGDMAPLYGAAFAEALAGVPVSALVAEGSPVSVSRPGWLQPASTRRP